MDIDEMKKFKFWTTSQNDLWIMESYCLVPSCNLRNLDTGKIKHFGLGGITAAEFNPIKINEGFEKKLFELFKKDCLGKKGKEPNKCLPKNIHIIGNHH